MPSHIDSRDAQTLVPHFQKMKYSNFFHIDVYVLFNIFVYKLLNCHKPLLKY